MGLYRYTASADTTITNAFDSTISNRGTGSNMGLADSLEVFSIYGQDSGSAGLSQEKSRILIKFPVDTMSADRTAGTIPASGSVSWFLRLYNTEHPLTLPSEYTLAVKPVSTAWDEGLGLDMESYTDRDEANWELAQSGSSSNAVAVLTATSKTAGQANTRVLNVTDADGNTVNFTIDNSISTSTATKIAFGNANSNATQFATNIAAAINAAADASPATLNTTATSSGATVTLTQKTTGFSGETTTDGTAVTDSIITVATAFSTLVSWTTEGGDYHTTAATLYSQTFKDGHEDLDIDISELVEQWIAGTKNNYGVGIMMSGTYEDGSDKRSYYTKRFSARGTQYFFQRPVIEARWDKATFDQRNNFNYSSSLATAADNLNTVYLHNYVRGQLKDIPSLDAAAATATVTVANEGWMEAGDKITLISTDQTTVVCTITAIGGTTTSATATTAVEAAIANNSTTDTATNIATAINYSSYFTATSSGAVVTITQATTGKDGNTTVTLTDLGGQTGMTKTDFVGGVESGGLYINLYSGSADNTSPSGDPLLLVKDGVHVTGSAKIEVVGGRVSTGVYSGSFAATASSTPLTKLFDVWYRGGVEYFTGTISPTSLAAPGYDPNPNYVINITNLKTEYTRDETARFRVFTRLQNWNPTIYTKATATAETTNIEKLFYKIRRPYDDTEVIAYGTGSVDYTKLSYDTSGSYFDLNIDLLESGYLYEINFIHYTNGKYVKQPEVFRFKVK